MRLYLVKLYQIIIMASVEVESLENIQEYIVQFRGYLCSIIFRTFGRDKCTARDRLSDIDNRLSELIVYLITPVLTLCLESIDILKKNVIALKPIRLVTQEEKKEINQRTVILLKQIYPYLRQKALIIQEKENKK